MSSDNLSEPYILLVDDEPQNLLLLSEFFTLEGYKTEAVSSGAQAIAVAEAQTPQLIVLDVMMPGMDGFEVCTQLRADPETSGITNPQLQQVPIIFLTALEDSRSRLQGLQAMGDDYLTKPVSFELLLAKVNSLLKLHSLRQHHHQAALTRQVQTLQQAHQQFKQQMMSAWKISEALSEKFRLFVPEQFLTRIAPRGVESIAVGNVSEAEVTVLFCDIRNFTALVEFQAARDTFTWLNALFDRLNRRIVEHHGFIDKYLGDAVMVVFDRPEQHRLDGVGGAIAICQAVTEFNRSASSTALDSSIQVGIGLSTGVAAMGTLGASQRMDTTVVGDVVNTAARLEELSKTYSCQIVASETVIDHLPTNSPYRYRWLAQIAPRGKQQPLHIYELLVSAMPAASTEQAPNPEASSP